MPAISATTVLQTITPLPLTLPIRKTVMVENQSPYEIYVSTDPQFPLGVGHLISSYTSRTFPGPMLYARATTNQDGVFNNQTIVTEYE